MKYEHVPVIVDEDIEIIFSIVRSHSCLSGAELHINIQPIEDTGFVLERDDNKVFGWKIGMIIEVTKNFVSFSPYATDNIQVNTSLKDIDELLIIVDSKVHEIIIRQVSLYIHANDTVYVSNYPFEEDIENEDDIEDDG